MPFDFPGSPTTGQTFTPSGGPTYSWNGYAWTTQATYSPGALIGLKVFTASGTYTPTIGMAAAVVECIGGGGGANAVLGTATTNAVGAGGGSGGYSRRLLAAAQIGASQTITIGAGGPGVVSGSAAGTDGGATSFGSLCVANGGKGAPTGAAAFMAGGAGGTPGTGDVIAAGAPGGGGCTGSTTPPVPSKGGSGPFGGGGVGTTISGGAAVAGKNADNYGSGGGGGAVSAVAATAAGGNGSAGVCIITEYGPSTNTGIASAANIRTFTANGTYVPPQNLISAIFECIGGGGGGGGSDGGPNYTGGGGGGGGYSRKVLTAAQLAPSIAYTVGAGGTSSGNGNGTVGGDTFVGASYAACLCGAKGGSGGFHGFGAYPVHGGAGGVPGIGDVTAAGNGGAGGAYNVSGPNPTSCGQGGAGPFGGAPYGINPVTTNLAGPNASSYGAGGGGAMAVTSGAPAGGNGSAGVIIVTEFLAVPISASSAAAPQTTYLTSGSGTYTTPAGATWLEVEMVGGGGGGAGGGGAQSGAGGQTSFGSITAPGGPGSSSPNTYWSGGPAAAGVGGDLTIPGAGGQSAYSSVVSPGGGLGAVSYFGGAGTAGGGSGFAGGAATANSGSGGGGGAGASGVPAGAGGSAGTYTCKIITNPAATYSYTVGVAGTGTVGSGGGGAGANGAAGIIIVNAYFISIGGGGGGGGASLPSGGTTGQVLAKNSATDNDVGWKTEVPLGGTANQVLTKNTGTDYDSSWQTPAAVSGTPTTGDAKLTIKTVPDSGWIMMDDGTIGDASSGASNRANADCQALFTLIWTNIPDAWAPVVGGRGANAAADWAAHKKITLMRQLGRMIGVGGAGAGLTSRVLGSYKGAETHGQGPSEMVQHVHAGPSGWAFGLSVGTANAAYDVTSYGIGTWSAQTDYAGGGAAMDIMNPVTFWNVMMKL